MADFAGISRNAIRRRGANGRPRDWRSFASDLSKCRRRRRTNARSSTTAACRRSSWRRSSPLPGTNGLTSNFSADGYRRAVAAGDRLHPCGRRVPGESFAAAAARGDARRRSSSIAGCASATRRRSPAISTAATGRSPARRRSDSSASTTATSKRGRSRARAAARAGPEADLFAGDELRASEKDRAENVMIVDLLRNDLSRTCRPESVRVSQLCGLETYEYVQHLVSVVEGTLARRLHAARPAADVVSRRLGHRCAEDSRDGDHRRAGADGARRVLRLARLHWLGRPDGHEYPHPNDHRRARLVAAAGRRRRLWPSRTRARNTKKRGTRRRGCCGRCGRNELNRKRCRGST